MVLEINIFNKILLFKDFGYENCIENGCQELMDGPSKADQFDDSDSEGGEAPDEFYVSIFYFF